MASKETRGLRIHFYSRLSEKEATQVGEMAQQVRVSIVQAQGAGV